MQNIQFEIVWEIKQLVEFQQAAPSDCQMSFSGFARFTKKNKLNLNYEQTQTWRPPYSGKKFPDFSLSFPDRLNIIR